MATFVITNIYAGQVHLGDYYKTLEVGEVITLQNRSVDELPANKSLQEAMTAGKVTLAIIPTADELGSGLLAPPNTVGGDDILQVADTFPLSTVALVRLDMAAGGGGAPDDYVWYALDDLPFQFRACFAFALISGAVIGETLEVRDEAGGGGTLLADISGAAVGYQPMTGPNATAVAIPAATKGLFVRRSDSAIAGEVFLLIRREA
jgi:hypothetical protein